MKPTIPFMELLSQWEILFNQFHGETLSLVQDPIEKFASFLEEKYPDVIKELLFLYSKLRLHIRIKYLNDNLELMDKTLHVRNVNHVNKYTSKKKSKRYITLNQLYCFKLSLKFCNIDMKIDQNVHFYIRQFLSLIFKVNCQKSLWP